MASRLKEDEKNEKIIRGLSKLPANRRCINCNTQVVLYVSGLPIICLQLLITNFFFSYLVKFLAWNP
jgi:hypothetical protein